MSPIKTYLFLGVLSVTLSILLWRGLQGSDDLGYARHAASVLQHGPHLDGASHKIGRIGAYLPLAAVFRIFGISEFSLAIIPVVCTALTSIIVSALGSRLYHPQVGLLAGVLHILFPVTLMYCNEFLPEPIVGFEISAAALLLTGASGKRKWIDGSLILVGLLMGIAYLTTEIAAIILLALLGYQWIAGNRRTAVASIVVGFSLVVFCELAFHAYVYGDPLHRFRGLGGNYSSDPMVVAANANLAERLLKSYPRRFVYPQMQMAYFGPLLSVAGLIGLVQFRRNLLLVLWAGAGLFFVNFFSSRLTSYVALPVAVRLLYPACIPLCILAAKVLCDTLRWCSDRNFLSRRNVVGVAALLVLFLGITSILSAYVRGGTVRPAVIAKNAKGVASNLSGEPGIHIVADKSTLTCIAFYRGFRSSDVLQPVEEVEATEATLRELAAHNGVLVVSGELVKVPIGDVGFIPFDERRKEWFNLALNSGVSPEFEVNERNQAVFGTLSEAAAFLRVISRDDLMKFRRNAEGPEATDWAKVFSCESLWRTLRR